MKWSVEGQSPEYLAVTRMGTLSPDVVDTILRHLDIRPGMRVLDVGCGSGEYVFRLGRQIHGVDFVGLEYDGDFVALANARVAGTADEIYGPIDPGNTYVFVQGDGMCLPFDDGEFDAVVSHTYLTAVPDYQGALAEMIRVCRPGGQVSSVTSMTSNFSGVGGFHLFSPVIGGPERELINRVDALKKQMRYIDMGCGIPTHKVQRLFAHLCLEDVSAVPLGQYFCLSDARLAPDDYVRSVDLLLRIEQNDVARMRRMPRFADKVTSEEWDDYLEVAEARHDYLVAAMGANQEWTWFGSAALLVWGRVPEDGLVSFCGALAAERMRANALRGVAGLHGWDVRERVSQAGPGRVCRVQLSVEGADCDADAECGTADCDGEHVQDWPAKRGRKAGRKHDGAHKDKMRTISACGFNPSLAFEEAYEELLDRDGKARATRHKAERRVKKALRKGAKPRPANGEDIFCIDLMWDTVAEANELGYTVKFFDVKKLAGMPATLCRVSGRDWTIEGVAAHEDEDVAIVRALSRALGQLAADFA